MRIGKNVKAMERRVADLFEKKRGVMCNSGSSALYLAYEAIDLQPGDEIVTSAVTFSTDVAPVVRKGAIPVFVDVTPDTFQIDVNRIAEMITPKTRAILAPNLIGNCPDWDVIRGIADEHNLLVIEDSCDALGQTLRGTPTGTRADISLTSFALSHIITAAGTGGMVCFDNDELADRALLFRRWGRRSEIQLFGSLKGKENRFFSALDDGLEYDNIFIFDENGWNFEPSELSAAFGLVQLDKLDENLARRQRSFAITSSHLAKYPHLFVLPQLTEGIETGWHMFPFIIQPDSGIRRADLQQWMESHGVDTRMVWTGNITRQPMLRDQEFRVPSDGLPNADRVMEWGLIVPNNHSLSDDDCNYIGECIDGFVAEKGL
jgi:CDP-6-deoxy-D-xylo-4-hexulose-3-dehydrase